MTFWDFTGKNGSSGITHVLVLDFGSGSVKAIVVAIEIEKKLGRITGIGKRYFETDSLEFHLPDARMVAEMARDAMESAVAMARVAPKECFIVLNGDVLKGISAFAQEAREKSEERITENSLQQLLERVIRNAKSNIAKESGLPDSRPLVIVEGAVERVEVDGYHVVNPLGFKGGTIAVRSFFFYITNEQKAYFDSIVAALKLHNKGFISSAFAIVQAQLKHTLTQYGAIFIDVGAHSTDVAMVQDSIMEGIKTFEVGGRALTDGMCDIFGIGREEAVKKKIQYEAGELSGADVKLIETGLRTKVDLLRHGVVIALKEFPESVAGYPEKIYLCGGGVRAQIVKRLFSQNAWLSGLHFAKRPIIEVLLASDVKDVFDETRQLAGPESVPMLSASRYASRHYVVTAKMEQLLRRAFIVQ